MIADFDALVPGWRTRLAVPLRGGFPIEDVGGGGGDVVGGEAVFFEEGVVGAGFAVGVLPADAAHGGGEVFGEGFGNGAAETADDGVVFGGDDGAGAVGDGDD